MVGGVVSYGSDRRCGRNPWSVFADVSYYSDWIKGTMSKIAKGGGGGGTSPSDDDDDDWGPSPSDDYEDDYEDEADYIPEDNYYYDD